jgi:hypothetical protein
MALTKLNNNAIVNVTALPSSVALGDMVLVSSATASSSATIDFTLGDYKEYQFYLVNIHPQTDDRHLTFNLSIDSGSNYNVTKTSSAFEAYHYENDAGAALNYSGGLDLVQSTGGQRITSATGADADQCVAGMLQLFNPSSTTYVKHYISVMNDTNAGNATAQNFIAGYANTTSALTNIRFVMEAGNIDAGQILMYGIN